MIPALQPSALEALLAEVALLQAYPDAGEGAAGAFGIAASVRSYKALSVQYLCELMSLDAMEAPAFDSDVRLRVALHLAPPVAGFFDPRQSASRRELVEKHLKDNFHFDDEARYRLSRQVAIVLDSWDARRARGLSTYKHKLLALQGYKCKSCKVPLENEARRLTEEEAALNGRDDPFKPYFDGNGVADAMATEVDHVFAVSREGTNALNNLQALCGLCNLGKSDGGGIRAAMELEHCYKTVKDIPRGHRIRMFYYRLLMDGFKCRRCGSPDNELTIRKHREGGTFVLTNLVAVCVPCVARYY